MPFIYLLKQLFSGKIKEAEFGLHIDTDDEKSEKAKDVEYGGLVVDGKLNLSDEQFDQFLDAIKKSTMKEVIKIKATVKEDMGLTDSKFGGYPYWPTGKEYPVNDEGKKLILLAQINLKDVHSSRLPKTGLLQFFIDCDDLMGLDQEKGHKVVFHKEIDEAVTEESVKALGIRAASDLETYPAPTDECFPIEKCHAIEFSNDQEFIFSGDCGFGKAFDAKLRELFGIGNHDSLYTFLKTEDFNKVSETFDKSAGHKLFGYPYFTQDDPRDEEENEILLFQMDTDEHIMWGDSGVGNFFITEAELKALNFENTRYNWDCC